MSHANPPIAPDNPSYIESLLAFLGDSDPLTVFSETPDLLRRSTASVPEAQLRIPEAPGKWSILAVVQHMGHTEVALAFRYRVALAEPGATLPAIDQNSWVDGLYPEDVSLADALEDFAALRAVNLRLLGRVDGEQWTAHGIHSQRGRETLGQMVRLYAAHDRYHLHQIERIKDGLSAIPT